LEGIYDLIWKKKGQTRIGLKFYEEKSKFGKPLFVFQMGYPNHAQWSKGVFFIIKLKMLNLQQFYDWICCYFEIHFHLGGGLPR
jgi:hypothetical protein